MNAEEPHRPGPGWWMASDGQLYPPEDHPDVLAGAVRSTAPPSTPDTGPSLASPPSGPSAAGPPPRTSTEGRRTIGAVLGGVFGACAVIAVLGGAFVAYRVFFALPSVSDDKTTLESALPTDADVPPGLIPGDELDDGKDDSTGDCSTTGVEPRAQVDVSYFEGQGDLGKDGFVMSAASFDDVETAESEIAEVDQDLLDRCFGSSGTMSAKETTGGVENASSSTVFIVEGVGGQLYAAVAQTGRFTVLAMATEADRALELAGDAIDKF